MDIEGFKAASWQRELSMAGLIKLTRQQYRQSWPRPTLSGATSSQPNCTDIREAAVRELAESLPRLSRLSEICSITSLTAGEGSLVPHSVIWCFDLDAGRGHAGCLKPARLFCGHASTGRFHASVTGAGLSTERTVCRHSCRRTATRRGKRCRNDGGGSRPSLSPFIVFRCRPKLAARSVPPNGRAGAASGQAAYGFRSGEATLWRTVPGDDDNYVSSIAL
jgi:hypothetical protein